MRRNRRGFLLIMGLSVLSTLLLLTSAGLTRSMTELRVANRFVNVNGAFHIAEGALDEALRLLAIPGAHMTVNELLDDGFQPAAIAGGRFAIEDDGNPTNDIVQVRAEGSVAGVTQRLRATVRLGQSIFDQGVMAWEIAMSGNAEIGEDGIRPIVSAHQNFTVGPVNDVYVSAIRMGVPITTGPGGSCPECNNPINFHPTHPGPGVPGVLLPAAVTTLSLAPYYGQAIAECQAQGYTPAACANGTAPSYHHIVSDATISAAAYPGGLDGVIYVEKGVNLDIASDVEIRGTIVHEGYDDRQGVKRGHLQITGANVVIDSTGSSFAPGVAVVGGPLFISTDGSSATIRGFVMVGSTYSGDTPNTFAGNLAVEGSVISSCWFPNLIPHSTLGPGVGAVNWDTVLHQIELKDGVMVKYRTPPQMPPGFGFINPQVLSWQTE